LAKIRATGLNYGIFSKGLFFIDAPCRGIIYAVNAHIEVAISFLFRSQSDKWGEFAIFPQIWLQWQHPLRYWKTDPDQLSAPKVLSFCEKIMKIGPVYPEIIVLRAIIKINASKIYSPLGRHAKRAISLQLSNSWASMFENTKSTTNIFWC